MPILLGVIMLWVWSQPAAAQARPLRVVTSLATYASIAREITGERATVAAIAQGDEEPHFVQPRPSVLPLLAQADLFVTTGLDLELWVPALLDKAGNRSVVEGAPGYVAAARGIALLDVPTQTSRTEGDIHVYGNPHIHTDPINAIQIARNILAGLERIAPQEAGYFRQREADFEQRMLERLYGPEIVRLLTPQTLYALARSYEDWDFLQRTRYEGAPLATRLGGWLAAAAVFRGQRLICYHKEWVYFSNRFGLPCAEYVEPKPGIPPSPRHVQRLIEMMRRERISVLFSPNYYDRRPLDQLAARTGARPVIVPAQTQGTPGVETYEQLIDHWITALLSAFAAARAAETP